ncbi:hypothetical protein BH686_04395 [Rhodococcus erythropolis]|nr:hypothetical protein BH686_04395 [Rhodococcus erythropolis]
MLGFYIILRDKKNSEKEQIQKLITREVWKRNKDSPHSIMDRARMLVMTNASDSPFYDVRGTMYGNFVEKPRISWGLKRWLKPRHWPVGTAERRRIASLKYAIQRGGRDDWHFKWPESGDPDISNNTMESGQTVTTVIRNRTLNSGKVVTTGMRKRGYPEIYFVITVKDAMGRHWALESKTRTIFRYEKIAYRFPARNPIT